MWSVRVRWSDDGWIYTHDAFWTDTQVPDVMVHHVLDWVSAIIGGPEPGLDRRFAVFFDIRDLEGSEHAQEEQINGEIREHVKAYLGTAADIYGPEL